MNSGGPSPSDGRVRSRPLVAGAAGIVLLVSLGIVSRLLSDEGARPGSATDRSAAATEPVGEAATRPGIADHGTLVYAAAVADGDSRLIWVVDLETGAVRRGPLVPAFEEMRAAGQGSLVLIGRDGSERVATYLPDLTREASPVEIARGDVIAQSTDGRILVVGERSDVIDARCEEPAYRLTAVVVSTGRQTLASREPLPCGWIVSAGMFGTRIAVVSVLRDGVPNVHLLWPNEPGVLFEGFAHVALGPNGTLLLVDRAATPVGDHPLEAPTGSMVVWSGGGSPRPLVPGSRLDGERVVALDRDGAFAVVDGAVAGERTLWLVDVEGGTARRLLPADASGTDLASAGATFDDDGTAFVATSERIVASTPEGAIPVETAGAPPPVGPVAWLP